MSCICLHAGYFGDVAANVDLSRLVPDTMECRFYRYCRQYRIDMRQNRRRGASRNKTVSNTISFDRCESSTGSRESRDGTAAPPPAPVPTETSWQTFRNGILPRIPSPFSLYLIRSLCSASGDEKYPGPGLCMFCSSFETLEERNEILPPCAHTCTRVSDRALISAGERLGSWKPTAYVASFISFSNIGWCHFFSDPFPATSVSRRKYRRYRHGRVSARKHAYITYTL